MGEIATFRASDGYSFYYRRYAASGRPRARLVFLHGIRSHGGWYIRSCEAFAASGFEVYSTAAGRAEHRTARRLTEFRRLLDDTAEFVQALRADRGYLPVFACGISWGGKLAVGLPYRKPGLVDGLVLLCPGLAPKIAPPLPKRLRIALASRLRPDRRFPIPLNEPELFTASADGQKFIDTDPHGLRLATARFLFGSFAFDIYLRRAAKRVTVPMFLTLAEHDRIIDNGRGRSAFPSDLTEFAGAPHADSSANHP